MTAAFLACPLGHKHRSSIPRERLDEMAAQMRTENTDAIEFLFDRCPLQPDLDPPSGSTWRCPHCAQYVYHHRAFCCAYPLEVR